MTTPATPGGEGKLAEARAAILTALDGYRNRRRYSDPPAVFGDTVDALIAAARAEGATAERARLAGLASEEDREMVDRLWHQVSSATSARHDRNYDMAINQRLAAYDSEKSILATLTARRAAAMEEGGAGLIAAERRRQVDAEGWTAEHDDAHRNGEMARAAAVYAWGEVRPVFVKKAWPWSPEWFKPEFMYWRYHPALDRGERSVGDVDPFSGGVVEVSLIESRVRVLTKAGALIAAEIDRLTRALVAPPPATAGEG